MYLPRWLYNSIIIILEKIIIVTEKLFEVVIKVGGSRNGCIIQLL